jgi:hypothetical protein
MITLRGATGQYFLLDLVNTQKNSYSLIFIEKLNIQISNVEVLIYIKSSRCDMA